MKLLPLFLIPILLASCATTSTAPPTSPAPASAIALLKQSAVVQAGGVSTIEAAYTGEWKFFAKATQPVLTDTAFRKSSVETYRGGGRIIEQVHTGPGGKKMVRHTIGGRPRVVYNGETTRDSEAIDAAALVAEAYALFIFGAEFALDHGRDFTSLAGERVDGKDCAVVQCRIPGGFGNSAGDLLRLSIDLETFVCRRVYFSINGLESTRGAEVDVTMSGFVKGPRGTLWPTRFYERVRKPVNAPAHVWRATRLVVDGRKVL